MKKTFFLIFIAFSLNLIGQTRIKSQDTLLFDKGEGFYFKNNLLKARKYYSKAIKINPNFIYAYIQRSCTYSERNKNQTALADLKAALNIDSTDTYAINAIGMLHRKMGNIDVALNYFNKAILLDSTYFGLYTNRGALYLDLRDYSLAKSDILNAIRLNTDNTTDDDYLNLSFLYSEVGQYKSSLDAVNNCLVVNPYFKEAYEQRADVYKNLNDPVKELADRKTVKKLKKKKNFKLVA